MERSHIAGQQWPGFGASLRVTQTWKEGVEVGAVEYPVASRKIEQRVER